MIDRRRKISSAARAVRIQFFNKYLPDTVNIQSKYESCRDYGKG